MKKRLNSRKRRRNALLPGIETIPQDESLTKKENIVNLRKLGFFPRYSGKNSSFYVTPN